MLKQLRSFLRDHLGEIVTLNFNHEIQQPEKVFPALSRQLLVGEKVIFEEIKLLFPDA